MSQLNSEYYSKAVDWYFPVEGDVFPSGAAGKNLGLQLNPGESVWSSGYNVLSPITTSGNPAIDTMTFFFIINLGTTFQIASDTINNLNALLNAWRYNSVNPSYPANATLLQNPFPIATPGVFQIKASSTAPITGGHVILNLNCTQHYLH